MAKGFFAINFDHSSQELLKRIGAKPQFVGTRFVVASGINNPGILPERYTAADIGKEVVLRVLGYCSAADNSVDVVRVGLVRGGEVFVDKIVSDKRPAHFVVSVNSKKIPKGGYDEIVASLLLGEPSWLGKLCGFPDECEIRGLLSYVAV